ncbi:GDSL-type esterase/lipase family protein [Longimycelium tulufanense]|nr:GDSL-type esterase/lipase family protein [Longimycelium tulufanense]
MRPLRHRLLVLLLLPVFFLLILVSDRQVPTPPAPPEDKPHALVSLGDSTISGEAAGDYEPGTNGENGNWCHRSPNSLIHRTALPGIDATVNLACSGANSADVALGEATQYTETSQAARLTTVAREYRIQGIVVGIGANDDPRFGDVVSRCLRPSERRGGDCHPELESEWLDRIDRMVPKVVRALTDIRHVMRAAGYPDDSYALVLLSYAAPVGPRIPVELQNLNGCPFRKDDLHWVESNAVIQLAAGLRRAADQSGVRFLDLSRAGRGHEACAGGSDLSKEWFSRLIVDWHALTDDQRSNHATQESFHPNARGHSQFGRCLGEFLATDDRAAACLPGRDGYLHPAVGQAVHGDVRAVR